MSTYEQILNNPKIDLSRLKITAHTKPPQCELYKKLMDKEL